MKPFASIPGATVVLAADTASDTVAFDATKLPSGDFDCRVFNDATDSASVDFGISTVTVTGVDMLVAPGATEVFRVLNTGRDPVTHAAAKLDSGTGNVYFTPGNGL
jgi:hypothetical protein